MLWLCITLQSRPPPLQRLYEIEKDGLNRIFEKIDFFYTPPTHPPLSPFVILYTEIKAIFFRKKILQRSTLRVKMYFENKNKLNSVEFKRIHLLDRTFLRYCDIFMPAYQHTLNEMQKVWYIYFKLFFFIIYKWYIMTIVSFFFLICRKCPQFRFRYYC